MKIAILGAGGVGGYFGGRLAAAGDDVTFVARGPHLDAIRSNGLRIVSPLGDTTVTPVRAVGSIEEAGNVDMVIVGVKLWDTEAVAATLRPVAERGAAVLSLQNGVAKDEILARHIPRQSLVGGVCYIAAVISEPGVITHSGTMQGIKFGEYDGKRSARVEELLASCVRAKIDAEISDDISRLIWEKFVFLVGLSGTTTSIRKPVGPIRENPQTREFLLEVMREVVAVGRARKISLSADYADNRLAFCDTLPATMTSSMHHDLERGNRLELPWLSGYVAELGKQLGVATPLNRAISDILALHVAGQR
ncbi:ketopantoate reductase family protein [Burkholderia cenocepacia]|uniref:ketopantoate reductase family protein n=1 Tax=Burkholderia cenocepacia TaxID=95486 RepID=UPI0028642290|nr:2-dehydropantoate 2-reductase [Burkholderia cenocepacia]MDR5644427.1 2-dehydropantoate 2-reductase [Burkholderia cenocepacia]